MQGRQCLNVSTVVYFLLYKLTCYRTGLIIALCACTLLAAVTSRQYLFNVPLRPHLMRDHQIWRLPLHNFVFANSSELFLGVLLLFYTSVPVERSFGSTKFAVSTIWTLCKLLLTLRPTYRASSWSRPGCRPSSSFSRWFLDLDWDSIPSQRAHSLSSSPSCQFGLR